MQWKKRSILIVVPVLFFLFIRTRWINQKTTTVAPYQTKNSCQPVVIPELKELAKNLIKLQERFYTSPQDYQTIGDQIHTIIKILQLQNDTTLEDIVKSEKSRNIVHRQTEKRQEVCPEEFKGKKLDYGYPYFRKGFGRVNCKEFIPIEKLVTLLIRIPGHRGIPSHSKMMGNIAAYYGKIRVILATEKPLETNVLNSISKLNISFENDVTNTIGQSALWKRLVAKVTTPYLLIAENITHFDDDINLERLVRVLSYEPDVLIAGGAHRNLKGEWDMGCQQIVFKNWTASYQGGYYRSFNECVVCDHISGPFMTKTDILKHFPFDEKLKFGAFHDIFWRIRKQHNKKAIVSCPDVMFNINEREIQDEEYFAFATKHKIHKIIEPSGIVRWFGCRKGLSYGYPKWCPKTKGMALSPCCMENLADAVNFFMDACHEAGAFCEIVDGTAMGAVKFNGVLPWELDADIAFEPTNFTLIKNLTEKMAKAGYELDAREKPKVKNGALTGGYFALRTPNWRIEIFGISEIESARVVQGGEASTKVLHAGQWVKFARNPGLYVRNHYGVGIYQHREHWSHVKGKDYWSRYDTTGSFYKCPQPGDPVCLDNYYPDGNMQFRNYPSP